MSAPCGMEEEKDPRFRRLSTVGAAINFVALILALTAVASYHWATLSVASYVAGAGAIMATISLAFGMILAPLVVLMHTAQHAICVKFRHAIFARLIATNTATFSSLISCISFFLEAKIFFKMQNADTADLSWSFYMEIITFVLSGVTGLASSYEWRWSRKLGGDPTVYTRDPEGLKADTIVNPNFRDAPLPGASPGKASRKGNATGGRSGSIQWNANGVAMTAVSGLPYSITANGANRMNGHAPNGRARVAFDPKKTPLRSSLRRPKVDTNGGGNAPSSPEDVRDSPTPGIVHNPTFASTSPAPKKKVRIHTQSTAV